MPVKVSLIKSATDLDGEGSDEGSQICEDKRELCRVFVQS